MAEAQRYFEAVGRRKEATARVRLYPQGSGKILINDKPMEQYFGREIDYFTCTLPLRLTGADNRYNVSVRVNGGGISGQAQAIRLGIARALLKVDPEYRSVLKPHGLLTCDARVKERKKPGLKRARKAPTYTKR
ncbi:MAG: 30S ribosomal protein S9 [Thermoflexales bacterium]